MELAMEFVGNAERWILHRPKDVSKRKILAALTPLCCYVGVPPLSRLEYDGEQHWERDFENAVCVRLPQNPRENL